MKRIHVGISSSMHDSAYAIVDDQGQILFAEAAERYLQNKRALNTIPLNAVRASQLLRDYCPSTVEIRISYSWKRSFLTQLQLKSLFGIFAAQDRFLNFYKKKVDDYLFPGYSAHWAQTGALSVMNFAGAGFKLAKSMYAPQSRLREHSWEHHLCHAGFACYGSPFDEGVCVVVDGNGERGSYSIYRYFEGEIHRIFQNRGLASLGVLYNTLTQACGFSYVEGEQWKVMGLAPYGKKNDHIYKILQQLIQVDGLRLRFPSPARWNRAMVKLSRYCVRPNEPKEMAVDLAHTGQLFYADTMNRLLRNVYDAFPLPNLILSGGCALNSAYNGTILLNTPFRRLHIPSAPADDGNALGAALLSYYREHPSRESRHKGCSPYLGSEITGEPLSRFLRFSDLPYEQLDDKSLFERTAHALAQGKIVGWVQGRAEFGPRALGNRSILADPRREDMKNHINLKVKFREPFRPFAPSILAEHGAEYFEHYQASPYMERTLLFRPEVRRQAPAVVHENGTGRLQTVTPEQNPRYYRLLSAFHRRTGLPILLNTSFNIKGKPIINSVEDALGVFLATGMDVLVIGNYWLEKNGPLRERSMQSARQNAEPKSP